MIKYVLIILNLIISLVLSIFCIDLNLGMTILCGFAFFIACFLVEAIIFFLILIIAGLGAKKGGGNTIYHKGLRKVFNLYIRFANSLFSIKIKFNGKDMLPEGPCLFIANHRSNLDPFVMEAQLKNYPLIFVAKKPLFYLPFFGRIITKIGYQSISSNFLVERDPKEVFQDKKHDLQTIKNCITLANEQQVSVAIYPEAMRNFTDNVLLEFKHGCFHIARKTTMPIVVMSIKGTEDVKNNILFKKHPVEINVLKVDTKDYYMSKTNEELAKEYYDLIYNDIKDYYTK